MRTMWRVKNILDINFHVIQGYSLTCAEEFLLVCIVGYRRYKVNGSYIYLTSINYVTFQVMLFECVRFKQPSYHHVVLYIYISQTTYIWALIISTFQIYVNLSIVYRFAWHSKFPFNNFWLLFSFYWQLITVNKVICLCSVKWYTSKKEIFPVYNRWYSR